MTKDPSRVRTLPPTSFGKPLKGGSKLTQMLHGSSLGSADRTEGTGVGGRQGGGRRERVVLRAGYAVGSDNLKMPPPSIGGSLALRQQQPQQQPQQQER